MKKLRLLGVLSLFIGMSATTLASQDRTGKDRDVNDAIRDRFVGAWRLASLEQEGTDGKIRKSYSTGLLVFTRDGHMSVQVMDRNPPAQAPAGPKHYSQGGYEASFGTYEIDDAHTFTFHVEGALVRTLIGKDLPRAFEFLGKQLVVKSTSPDEHWRVAWEH
ncbi:MAG TPA: lipocalin-like domain-containing protein [Terriglobales bacterium]|nr:lipocalin-like domain-containing protein [Terriglobales bacterium]